MRKLSPSLPENLKVVGDHPALSLGTIFALPILYPESTVLFGQWMFGRRVGLSLGPIRSP